MSSRVDIEKSEYFAAHQAHIEEALSESVEQTVDAMPAEPIAFLSASLAKRAVVEGSVEALRRFLRVNDEVAQQARNRVASLQSLGNESSRTGYLRALSDIIGPDPRPLSSLEADATRQLWIADWRRMYMEHKGLTAEPVAGWDAIERKMDDIFRSSVKARHKAGWAYSAADAYTWLSSIEARNPMSKALRDANARYAAATYTLCQSMMHLELHPPTDGQPAGFRNLVGRGGLVESDPRWTTLEQPDPYGFRGLTSSALVRPMFEERYFDQRGWLVQCGRYANEFEGPSDIVGFVCAESDEHGYHAGLMAGRGSIVFPPNTLFRLQKIFGPGEWVAPGGARPEQRLLIVTCTFRLPAVVALDRAGSRVCEPPTVLEYGARDTYVRGLNDVLTRPLLSLEEEWTRDMTWRDRAGKEFSLQKEWAYVTSPVPAQAAQGSGMGARDEGNVGMAPSGFQGRVNEHIRRQRAAHEECRSMREKDALLTEDETLALRLYTGPGYQPLNEFLRQLGKLTGVVRKGVATHAGLTFTATTALLCHAIRKLAAVTSPSELDQPLYRAVRGELPPTFWVADEQGMVCAVDCGFMSSSKNRETPIHYMGGQANVLWELHPSGESDMAYHRGASVELLSQFAKEEEVIFPPCTMLVVLRSQAQPDQPPSVGRSGELHHETQGTEGATRAINSDGQPVDYIAIRVSPFFI